MPKNGNPRHENEAHERLRDVNERLAEHLRASNDGIAAALQGEGATPQVMAGFAEAYRAWLESLSAKPETLLELQNRYMQEQFRLWGHALQPAADEAPVADKRFSGAEWNDLPVFRYFRDSYLSTAKMMMQAVEEAELDPATKQRMRFFMRQYLDAASPSNYLFTNPEALKAAMESRGETLTQGLQHLLGDLEKGHISMTDESAFEVGKNIAVSPGSVVWENELVQLIQYAPLTAKVHARPLLMVPPCINKFYILDLQPENSLVRYVVEQGHTVFMVSWRNPKEDQQGLTWDDYLREGVIAPIEEVRRITKQERINALGFCVGGTLLAAALAVLEEKGEHPVASLTLLATLLDFTDVGEIRVYIDENFVAKREKQLEKGGLVPGGELAAAFSSLRANDLVWPYVVNNYLKGKSPPAFDLLFWNSDATNLPGPMYAYYLRNTYQDNKLVKPDALTMCGVPVSLKRVKMPTFVFSAREDHIVPWRGGYKSARALGAKAKYVLGASGHIAGTINPASKKKRSYWVNGALEADPEAWLAQAQEKPGSWWPEWIRWLAPHAGKRIAARRSLGDTRHKPIEPAPGRYVKERA
ncbi:MAG TPA: class I poly(R)-hydroxyalkanoic acid synthase [Usitatibacter sp.]|nr:class I poly(R)-hydroxyalkanoic acid synthase [Usitatibacter sp.]HXS54271.1 class I poly(R)-hydroxyalkanoic acid synthase [Usitatibacter sp.]